MSFSEVIAGLYARVPRGMRLSEESLDAMRDTCARAGNPERAFDTVHVAGTNGKGSVCAMVESIARAAGVRTGLYTSPHLCSFAERVRVNGEPISDEALESVLSRALELGPELSFFETATLAAFLAFHDAKVELAVIEVGIGGRLDATNVLPAERARATAVTRIAFDHMEMLGDTLVAIAREKAAIAKPGVPMVVGDTPADVRAAIDEIARAHGTTTVNAGGDDARAALESVKLLGLHGAHQRQNAEVAYRLAKLAGFGEGPIATGLAAVRWAGRLESIDAADGAYLLDGAHNPDGARALADHLVTLGRPFALVFGALADKAWTEMIDTLAPLTPHRVYVRPKGRAATEPAELANRHPGEPAASVADALARARTAVGSAGTVVVAGSLYLVGEARAAILGLDRDPPVAL